MRLAIATTIIDAEPHLETFVNYHLSIGFDLLILFFDDPSDPSANKYANSDKVIVVKNDDRLKKKWEKVDKREYWYSFSHKDVMSRQLLNLNVALKMASALKIDWILHIDVDELFYSPEQTVRDHFSRLNGSEVDAIAYLNHEAISETIEVENIFKGIKYFKKNYAVLNADQKKVADQYVKEGVSYFNFYNIGKSAGRIRSYLRPITVHEFRFRPALPYMLKMRRPRKRYFSSDVFPCILHYPCCGFDFFWRKYRLLGDFEDKWWNMGKEIKEYLPMHVLSRDVCKKNNIDEAMQFYKEHFLERNLRYLDLFRQEGICLEVPNLFK
jgi:hypothetical protein